MKGNPKQLILDINAVKSVYVESCYKIFMSAFKTSDNNDDIIHVYDLPFDEMCLSLKWKSIWHRAWRIDNQCITRNNLLWPRYKNRHNRHGPGSLSEVS